MERKSKARGIGVFFKILSSVFFPAYPTDELIHTTSSRSRYSCTRSLNNARSASISAADQRLFVMSAHALFPFLPLPAPNSTHHAFVSDMTENTFSITPSSPFCDETFRL